MELEIEYDIHRSKENDLSGEPDSPMLCALYIGVPRSLFILEFLFSRHILSLKLEYVEILRRGT